MPESAVAFYERVCRARQGDGTLPVRSQAHERTDFPLVSAGGVRVRGLDPLDEVEMPRFGEDAATCWCARDDAAGTRVVWEDPGWRLTIPSSQGLPFLAILVPRAHSDVPGIALATATSVGPLFVALAQAIEALPSVGRAAFAAWGDLAAHAHCWVYGRPARVSQMAGPNLPLWEEYLPRIPPEVAEENTAFVVERVVATYGGTAVGASLLTPADG